jgi:hypothetical protein
MTGKNGNGIKKQTEIPTMKIRYKLLSACFLVLLLTGSGFAFPTAYSLLNTKWTGNITVVDSNGATTTITGSTLTFSTESNDFVSGTISDPAITFSGIKDDFGRSVIMTGVNYKISAEVMGGFRHGSAAAVAYTIRIQGSNLSDGSMFVGVLTKQ